MPYSYEFPRPSVATDICIFTIAGDDLAVVLIERSEAPSGWALPGGFLRPGETLEECAKREAYEETGVWPNKLFQFSTFSAPDRDPRGWTLSIAYLTAINLEKLTLRAGSDAKKAEIIPIKNLPKTLAFDHEEILNVARDELPRVIVHQPIALNLVSELFTLSELQAVYLALGMQEHRAQGNFYRFAKANLIAPGLIEETSQKRSSGRQRPARLFRQRNIFKPRQP